MDNINQLAAEAYLALHKLVEGVDTKADVTNEELTLEGESMIESFQGYVELLQEAEVC